MNALHRNTAAWNALISLHCRGKHSQIQRSHIRKISDCNQFKNRQQALRVPSSVSFQRVAEPQPHPRLLRCHMLNQLPPKKSGNQDESKSEVRMLSGVSNNLVHDKSENSLSKRLWKTGRATFLLQGVLKEHGAAFG